MSQNLIDLTYTAGALTTLDATLESLEQQFAGLLALNTDQRRHLTKMGDKSEAFCRQTVDVLGQNTGLLPATTTTTACAATWKRSMRCGRA